MDRAELTRIERRKLLNLYHRKILSAHQIKRDFGWTIAELSLIQPVSEEHYLIKCPKCQSRSVAMYRHYTNMRTYRVSAICRDCGTRSTSNTYIGAMVDWNKEKVCISH